jgi:hypothetical protein
MKLLVCSIVLLLIASGTAVAQKTEINTSPSWLLDSKRVSMHHSVSFSYGAFSQSYQSLYANSIRYKLSPQLTLSGTFGYYQYGGKYRNFKSMLHGFGLTYSPSRYLQIQLEYRGASPISNPKSTGTLNILEDK